VAGDLTTTHFDLSGDIVEAVLELFDLSVLETQSALMVKKPTAPDT
jgi:hypothetical protein